MIAAAAELAAMLELRTGTDEEVAELAGALRDRLRPMV
jgi:hypothetical protein